MLLPVSLLCLSALVAAVDPPCVVSSATPADICAQRGAFGGSLVVPQVLPSFLPVGYLHLQYGTVDVGGAQQLSPARVGSTPIISYVATPGIASGPTYILILLDSDSPNPSVLHWMQTDLTVQTTTNLLVSSAAPAAQYVGPAPPQGNGTHRYVAVLYNQPASFTLPTAYRNMPTRPMPGSARLGFNLVDFLTAAGLGEPVGGNFFKSTFDGTSGTNTVPSPTGTSPGGVASATAAGSSAPASAAVAAGTTTLSAMTGLGGAATSASSAAVITATTGAAATPSASTVRSSGASRLLGVDSGFAAWTFGLGGMLAMGEIMLA